MQNIMAKQSAETALEDEPTVVLKPEVAWGNQRVPELPDHKH